MLFNSYQFIFIFLPVVLLAYYLLNHLEQARLSRAWLVLTSLFFYAFWNPAYLPLLLLSLFVNYALSYALKVSVVSAVKRAWLVLGLGFNLGLLAYFKYANFFVNTVNQLFQTELVLTTILLPLAISFFTFQQIAYLVEWFRGTSTWYSFLDYSLFVVFFPQLIAGPIVHAHEILPQFARGPQRLRPDDIAIGLTIFLLGLFKKILIADSVAQYATPVFGAAATGAPLTLLEAWGGVLAYTFQLYFDFSGYSDMAIGLGRMFGITIPKNFDAPYKALNITEFWRKWHITLSRWLRDYLYIPLGGSRKGEPRRYFNLMLTMLLGGLWHGAGWTFVVWGGLHGLYLVVHQVWSKVGVAAKFNNAWGRGLSRLLTFTAVVVGWVFFRAESWEAANLHLRAMFGLGGVTLPAAFGFSSETLTALGVQVGSLGSFDARGFVWIAVLLVWVWKAPSLQQILVASIDAARQATMKVQRSSYILYGLILGTALFWVVKGYFAAQPSEFLYFNF
jgi:D-alanyl-lipoteichoic acid acyltransferase DltB (MBOAT superfamily)